jgi:hypothetical protein
VATLCGGGLNIVLSIALVKVGGMGLMGIALGSLVSLFFLEAICLPYFLCRALSIDGRLLLLGALRALLGAVPLALGCLLLHHVWTPTRLLHILAQFAVCGVIYAPAIWFISLTQTDHEDLRKTLQSGMAACRARFTRKREQP